MTAENVRDNGYLQRDSAEHKEYSDWVILSHFKGHAMAGFGGAIKNVAIGMSSPSGKVYVHTAGTKTSGSIWYNDQDAWLEALGEMVTGVRDHVGADHIIYAGWGRLKSGAGWIALSYAERV